MRLLIRWAIQRLEKQELMNIHEYIGTLSCIFLAIELWEGQAASDVL